MSEQEIDWDNIRSGCQWCLQGVLHSSSECEDMDEYDPTGGASK